MHVAIIMDGNRRYGRDVHGDPMCGHRAGADALQRLVSWCDEREGSDGLKGGDAGLCISTLTLYAFSSQNWQRPAAEVRALMDIFVEFADRLASETAQSDARFKVICTDAHRMEPRVLRAMAALEGATRHNDGVLVNLCFGYGAQEDIARACLDIHHSIERGQIAPHAVTAELVQSRLSTCGSAPPDLLIRTSGERRLSNFMLFECAYTELYFVEARWPEITREDIQAAISSFQGRQRRRGC